LPLQNETSLKKEPESQEEEEAFGVDRKSTAKRRKDSVFPNRSLSRRNTIKLDAAMFDENDMSPAVLG